MRQGVKTRSWDGSRVCCFQNKWKPWPAGALRQEASSEAALSMGAGGGPGSTAPTAQALINGFFQAGRKEATLSPDWLQWSITGVISVMAFKPLGLTLPSQYINLSIRIINSGPGLCPHGFLSKQPCREANSLWNGSHLLLWLLRNFPSSAHISSMHMPTMWRPRLHTEEATSGPRILLGGRVGPRGQTPRNNPSAKSHDSACFQGGISGHHLWTWVSVLGLGEDLRAEAESQATAPFPGDGQMLSRGTPGLRIRTRVPEGP